MSLSMVRRIAAIDDHALSLRGLASLTSGVEDIQLVATAATVQELVEKLPPGEMLDLVLLDLRLSDGSKPAANVEALKCITRHVLVFSSLESPYLVRDASHAQVLGMIPKTTDPEKVIEAIRLAADGYDVHTAEWASAIDSDPLLDAVQLSDRQREVLELYGSGEPAKRVASLTGLSQETVNDYLTRIRLKYALANRAASTKIELYQRALEDGWLPGPTDPHS
ncbi:response regulator transcription factor [Corynebacterium freiburgense]|uniref:response regulator transcription factor n=1 Tax=Corynebacterium freiburgense TaxID=556548 RepID=UPI000479BE70|nr:response regulator transcription factor [Corynebacterium freiburgense]